MIQLRLLGHLSLERDDGTAVPPLLDQPKRFALLAYLAAAHPPAEHRRDTLLGLFWSDLDQEHARMNLRQSLYQLRQALGPEVLTGKGSEQVGTDPGRLWCDAAAFERALDEGRSEDALELYRGPFLEGFHLSGALGFERWTEMERRRLQRRAIEAAWELARHAESEEDPTGARRWADEALKLAPYDGDALRRYLALMERLGQPASAVLAYEEYTERLARDLDLEPSEETVALIDRIRDGSARPAVAPEASGVRAPTEHEPEDVRTGRDGAATGPTARAPAESRPSLSETIPAGEKLRVAGSGAWKYGLWLGAALAVLALVYGGSTEWIPGSTGHPGIRTLAVLPLEDHSADPGQEHLGPAVTDGLTAELGKVSALRVVSRTSTTKYENTKKLAPQIARELGASGLIEGSVARSGEEIRLTLQLVHGPDDRHLWGRTVHGELRDLPAIVAEMALQIAEVVRAKPTAEEAQRISTSRRLDPDAYEAFLTGLRQARTYSEETHRAAFDAFQEAIALDSTFAEAYTQLCELCSQPGVLGIVATMEDCRAWGERAVELAPDLADAHANLGWIRRLEWNWSGAEAGFRTAIAMNRSNVRGRLGYAGLLALNRRFEEALAEVRRVEELDPTTDYRHLKASMHFRDGRPEEALALWRGILKDDPDHPNRGRMTYFQAYAHLDMGEMEEAKRKARAAARLLGEEAIQIRLQQAHIHAKEGDESRALEILAAVEEEITEDMSYSGAVASVYVRLGRWDEAMDRLTEAYRRREPHLPWGLSFGFYEPLRGWLPFRTLTRAIGLRYPTEDSPEARASR